MIVFFVITMLEWLGHVKRTSNERIRKKYIIHDFCWPSRLEYMWYWKHEMLRGPPEGIGIWKVNDIGRAERPKMKVM